MSIELFLYLADVLPRISEVLGVLAFFVGIGGVVMTAGGYIEDVHAFRLWGPMTVAFAVLVGITAALVPSKQTIYMMAGATVAKQALNSSIGQKVQQAIEDQLDEFIKKGAKK